jgi:hypothetical protein
MSPLSKWFGYDSRIGGRDALKYELIFGLVCLKILIVHHDPMVKYESGAGLSNCTKKSLSPTHAKRNAPSPASNQTIMGTETKMERNPLHW